MNCKIFIPNSSKWLCKGLWWRKPVYPGRLAKRWTKTPCFRFFPSSHKLHLYIQRCKTRCSPKEEFIKRLQFCHSINLKEAQRNVPNEFQFGGKCNLLGFFEYYLEVKCICSQLRKLVTSLCECKHINAEEADQSKDQFESFVVLKQRKVLKSFSSTIWLITLWTSSLDDGLFEMRSTHHSRK